MSDSNHHMERIDRYLKGQLTEEELQSFEAEMELDADLRNEVLLQRDIKIGAEAYFDEELREKLAAVEQQQQVSDRPGRRFFFKPWRPVGIAASVVLLLGLAYLILMPSNSGDPQALFASYYQPYPNIVNPIERSAANIQNDGLSNYEQGNYQQAVMQFEEELKQFPQSDFRLFYQALAYLEVGDNENALKNLAQINEPGEFYHPAQWYLALTYLKAENIDEAKNQLQVIADNPGDYQRRAIELLDKL